MSNGVQENPYLQHRPPRERMTGTGTPTGREPQPLLGFLPRKVTAAQVLKVLVRVFLSFSLSLQRH